jgi:lipoprotein-anchoring transpeptidase ErfK/SrfK
MLRKCLECAYILGHLGAQSGQHIRMDLRFAIAVLVVGFAIPAQQASAQYADDDDEDAPTIYDGRGVAGPYALPPYPPDDEAYSAPYGPPPRYIRPGEPIWDYGGVPPARPPADVGQDPQTIISSLPPEDQPEQGDVKELPPQFQRQTVDYRTKEPAGTIIIDTPHTYLYLVLGDGKAIRYGIGVGREGFTWAGREKISRMAEWPDWYPPADMIQRQPYLPRMMAGGPGNPLGARALYLGNTLFRIHGTNQPSTIGHFVSSGCIRLLDADVEDMYRRVHVGTRVIVLPGKPPADAAAMR